MNTQLQVLAVRPVGTEMIEARGYEWGSIASGTRALQSHHLGWVFLPHSYI